MCIFLLSFVYIWIAVWDPVIKRDRWTFINLLCPATYGIIEWERVYADCFDRLYIFVLIVCIYLFWSFVYICFAVWDPDGWAFIYLFSPATLLCLYQSRKWISNGICRCCFYHQWLGVKGDYSFCWFWWICQPSLFKLSFFFSLCAIIVYLYYLRSNAY